MRTGHPLVDRVDAPRPRMRLLALPLVAAPVHLFRHVLVVFITVLIATDCVPR